MRNKVIIGLIVILIAGGAGFYLLSKNDSTTTETKTAATTPSTEAPQSTKPASATIVYDSNGFSPSTITVKSGDTIAIKNTSSGSIQFDSDPHPDHTDNTELNVGVVDAGETKSFVVTKTGTFGIHNHLDPTNKSTIVVQ